MDLVSPLILEILRQNDISEDYINNTILKESEDYE